MKETSETIQAALHDLKRQTAAVEARVAAFEKEQREEEEPPALDSLALVCLEAKHDMAARRLRYVERELARLREGLKVQPDDRTNATIEWYATSSTTAVGDDIQGMAREIQRHRKLVAK